MPSMTPFNRFSTVQCRSTFIYLNIPRKISRFWLCFFQICREDAVCIWADARPKGSTTGTGRILDRVRDASRWCAASKIGIEKTGPVSTRFTRRDPDCTGGQCHFHLLCLFDVPLDHFQMEFKVREDHRSQEEEELISLLYKYPIDAQFHLNNFHLLFF